MSTIAPGHNPHNLTIAQVGEEYRLLDPDEILDGIYDFIGARPVVQRWIQPEGWTPWETHGAHRGTCYRTNLTRAVLRQCRGIPAEHNPIRVPASELPAGHRFLDAIEIGRYPHLVPLRMFHRISTGFYCDGAVLRSGDSQTITYCTDMSRGDLARVRESGPPYQSEPAIRLVQSTKPRHPELCTRYGTE